MNYTSSQENYVYTIYQLSKKLSCVRSIDIARETERNKASIHKALHVLEEKKLINFIVGDITLTKKGVELAENLEEKNRILTCVLKKLGVNEELALEEARDIKYVVTDSLIDFFKNYIKD